MVIGVTNITECPVCRETRSDRTGFNPVVKVVGVIYEGEPKAVMCESCIMERLTGERPTINVEMERKYGHVKERKWWHI